MKKDNVTYFSQFISVKVKEILRQSQAQYREKLRKLRFRDNDGFFYKKKCKLLSSIVLTVITSLLKTMELKGQHHVASHHSIQDPSKLSGVIKGGGIFLRLITITEHTWLVHKIFLNVCTNGTMQRRKTTLKSYFCDYVFRRITSFHTFCYPDGRQ